MAQPEHLPIYKTSYDFCLYLEQVVREFFCYHKQARHDHEVTLPHPRRGARPQPWERPRHKGVLGNLRSQFWAKVYLNELDQFVKREVGCQYYLRYVDDLVLVSNDPGEHVAARGGIPEFLRERLGEFERAAVRSSPGGCDSVRGDLRIQDPDAHRAEEVPGLHQPLEALGPRDRS